MLQFIFNSRKWTDVYRDPKHIGDCPREAEEEEERNKCPNFICQTSLTSHGCPYLLGGMDEGWAGGEAGGQEERWEGELWMDCKIKLK